MKLFRINWAVAMSSTFLLVACSSSTAPSSENKIASAPLTVSFGVPLAVQTALPQKAKAPKISKRAKLKRQSIAIQQTEDIVAEAAAAELAANQAPKPLPELSFLPEKKAEADTTKAQAVASTDLSDGMQPKIWSSEIGGQIRTVVNGKSYNADRFKQEFGSSFSAD